LLAAATGKGLAASVLLMLASGRRPPAASISTSRAKASTKEAAKTYHWKRFEAGDNENPFSATSATQSTNETGLMSDDPYSRADRAGYAERRVKDTHGVPPVEPVSQITP